VNAAHEARFQTCVVTSKQKHVMNTALVQRSSER
jgi:hypothetical protein